MLNRFLKIAKLEGVSFLVLLFIAMPLKYGLNLPIAVTIVGWAHGVLFVLYLYFLLQVWIDEKWRFGKVLLAFTGALIPFGPWIVEKRLTR